MGTVPPFSRNACIAAGVVLFHVAALWALQAGLLRRAVEVIVPVELLSSIVTPPKAEAPPEPAKPVEPVARPVVVRKSTPAPAPAPAPAPRPVARADTTPAPSAPTGMTEVQPAPPPVSEPVAAAPAPAPVAPPAPAPAPRVELPVTHADYLQNPAPEYPRTSRRLGEEGTTVVRVLIGPDGRPQQANVARSSGFTRLDEAAVATAMAWRYVAGKRGGVPEAMWVNVPIKWEIKKD